MFLSPRFVGLLVVIACFWSPKASARWLGVPTVPFIESIPSGFYSLQNLVSIIVDSKFQDSVDLNGQTLIPPTLKSFAETFGDDLASTLGIQIPVKAGNSTIPNSIFLTLGNTSDYLDVAGRETSEGYTLNVTDSGMTVTGASPLGVFWATRTILQQATLSDSQLAFGSAVDTPGWGTRGVMIDVGRHYYPPEFIFEMCSYLSFFKQNILHLHLSDNLFNNVDIYTRERSLELYAAFRPNSDDPAVAGLSKRNNESYFRADFEMIQQGCAARGVTIIPELEAPGHALVITQWKPELGLSTDLSLLNITFPETIPTMQTIWKTFLPWFHSKIVHIGADEYSSDLVDDYTMFVNAMNDFIVSESGKAMRIWGTFPPSNGTNVNTSVSIQHWEFFEDNPYFDFIKKGYHVLNSDDAFYVVNKWSGSYPQQLNLTRVFLGNPEGGPMAPNIFDTSNSTNNPSRNDPNVIGQVAALWNDYGPNATSYIETYYALRDGLPALGDKQWGGDLLLPEYLSIIEPLISAAPSQNLDRKIPSKSSKILEYNFSNTGNTSKVIDSSGNGYDGTNNGCLISNGTVFLRIGCSIDTPLISKGRNYSLSFSVNPTSSIPGTLFSSPESSLLAGNGSISNVTLITAGNAYSLNYSLPMNTWTDVSLVGKGNATFLKVGDVCGNGTMEFLTKLGVNGDEFVWGPMAILAPLGRIGGDFEGRIRNVVLLDG